jgi:hypothetical protein
MNSDLNTESKDTPLTRSERMKLDMKARWSDPAFRAKMRASFNTPKRKEQRSMAARTAWNDPEKREKRLEKLKNSWDNPARREATHIRAKKLANTPEAKARTAKTSKLAWSNPESREKKLASLRSPERKEKWRNSMAEGGAAKVKQALNAFMSVPENLKIRAAKSLAVTNSDEFKNKMLKIREATGKILINLPRFVADHPQATHAQLRDPYGNVWEVHSLCKFVEDHPELFEPRYLELDRRGQRKAAVRLSKLTQIKNPAGSAMGWTLVSRIEKVYNEGEDLIERQSHEIHSI